MTTPVSRDLWLTCRDGVRLVSRVWQPAGDGPWPVLLMRQPYGRAIASTPTYAHPAWYAEHGFLVVIQDVRGQGDSQGIFSGFQQEARDGADTVRWARHLAGSNGRVGCYGFSYQGLTQLLSDADDPEGWPDCLAPAMAGLDERSHWASSGGAHWWALGLGWGLQLAALQCRRRQDHNGWQLIRDSLERGQFLQNGPDLLKTYDPEGMACTWLALDAANASHWRRHRPPQALLQCPMLLIGGWHDPHLEGVLDLWAQARSAGGDPLLRIGAWTHLNWNEGLDHLQLAFFRHHLQRRPLAPELAVAVAVQNERTGHWQEPSRADPRSCSWWLAVDAAAPSPLGAGRLLPEPPHLQARVNAWLVHDPWRPVPGRGGHLGLDAGSCERADLDGRRDVLCFTSSPLQHGLELVVQPRLRLLVRADQPGFDLCVALSRLETTGAVRQLSTGVLRQLGGACLQERWITLMLQPLMLQLLPGEALRLSIAAAAWPQIAVNPGSGAPALGGCGPEHRVITLHFNLSGAELALQTLGLDGGEPMHGLQDQDPGAN